MVLIIDRVTNDFDDDRISWRRGNEISVRSTENQSVTTAIDWRYE